MNNFIPKNIKKKYVKYHRAHLFSKITKFTDYPHVRAGVLALKILNFGFLFPKQLRAVFFTLKKLLKKKGIIYLYKTALGSFSKKPTGARMGKGKGKNVSSWVYKVCAGFILCEIHTKFLKLAIIALRLAKKKLPLNSKIIFCKNYKYYVATK